MIAVRAASRVSLKHENQKGLAITAGPFHYVLGQRRSDLVGAKAWILKRWVSRKRLFDPNAFYTKLPINPDEEASRHCLFENYRLARLDRPQARRGV